MLPGSYIPSFSKQTELQATRKNRKCGQVYILVGSSGLLKGAFKQLVQL